MRWWCTGHRVNAHAWTRLRRGQILDADKFDIKDQISLRRDDRVSGVGTRPSAIAVGELPGDKQPPPASDMHALKALIEAGNQAAKALRKLERLRVTKLRLAIFAHNGFAVLVEGGAAMVIRRIEFVAVIGAAIRSEIAGIENLVDLVGFGQGTSPHFKVLISKRKGCLHRTVLGARQTRG